MLFHSQVRDLVAQHQLNAKVAILTGRPQPQAIARHRSQQVPLGQMRALVRHHGLCAGEHYVAGESSIPQPRGDRVAGRTAADDQRSGRVFSNSRNRRRDQTRYPPRTTTAKAYALTR